MSQGRTSGEAREQACIPSLCCRQKIGETLRRCVVDKVDELCIMITINHVSIPAEHIG